MKIDLTKEELQILNDLCFREILELHKLRQNKFIDVVQIDTAVSKLEAISDKIYKIID